MKLQKIMINVATIIICLNLLENIRPNHEKNEPKTNRTPPKNIQRKENNANLDIENGKYCHLGEAN